MSGSASQAQRELEHVAGNDIAWTGTYYADDGQPMPLDGIDILAQVRTEAGQLLGTLTIDKDADRTGGYSLTLPYSDTLGWPEGLHRLDVRYTSGTERRNTQQIAVRVLRPVSRDD